MSSLVKEFNDYRTRMNEVILSKNNLVMKRLWNLDTNTYEEDAPGYKDERNAWIGCPPTGGCFVAMIVSNIILGNAMT